MYIVQCSSYRLVWAKIVIPVVYKVRYLENVEFYTEKSSEIVWKHFNCESKSILCTQTSPPVQTGGVFYALTNIATTHH